MALASEVCIWQDHLFFYFAGLPRSLLSSRFPLSSLLASELNQNRGSPIRLHCGVPFSLVNVKPTRITRLFSTCPRPMETGGPRKGLATATEGFSNATGWPRLSPGKATLVPSSTRYNNRYFALHLGACSQLLVASLPGSPTSESSTQQRLPSYRYL